MSWFSSLASKVTNGVRSLGSKVASGVNFVASKAQQIGNVVSNAAEKAAPVLGSFSPAPRHRPHHPGVVCLRACAVVVVWF